MPLVWQICLFAGILPTLDITHFFFFFQSLESRRTVCQLYDQEMPQSQTNTPSLKVGKMPVNMSIDRAGGYNRYKYMCKITSSLFPW